MPTGVYKRTKQHRKEQSKRNAGAGNGFFGKKHSKETKEKIRKARLNVDNPSYSHIHKTIRKKYGDAKYCEHCNKADKKRYEWANKDHKYSLKRSDWQRLCTSCHRIYDLENNI